MATLFFVTHPEVVIDPAVLVPEWRLSGRGRARMRAALARPWTRDIRLIVASTERKAIDAAEIFAAGLSIGFGTMADLGENDRSATGYLEKAEFESVADAFFACPEESVRGWERAIDAQRRIVRALEDVLALPRQGGDIAIIAHGAVGALLLCALGQAPISRDADQPPGGGGFYFSVDPDTRCLRQGWRPIDA